MHRRVRRNAPHPNLQQQRLKKSTLLALSWAIEDEATAQAARGVLVGTFQRGRFFGQSAERWQDFARTARGSLAMADFPEHDDDARPWSPGAGVVVSGRRLGGVASSVQPRRLPPRTALHRGTAGAPVVGSSDVRQEQGRP